MRLSLLQFYLLLRIFLEAHLASQSHGSPRIAPETLFSLENCPPYSPAMVRSIPRHLSPERAIISHAVRVAEIHAPHLVVLPVCLWRLLLKVFVLAYLSLESSRLLFLLKNSQICPLMDLEVGHFGLLLPAAHPRSNIESPTFLKCLRFQLTAHPR